MKMEINTKLGILVVSESTDPNYPGVFIDLKRNSEVTLPLACVECQ